MEILYTVN